MTKYKIFLKPTQDDPSANSLEVTATDVDLEPVYLPDGSGTVVVPIEEAFYNFIDEDEASVLIIPAKYVLYVKANQ